MCRIKGWRPCGPGLRGRSWQLTASGPRSCPLHSASPGHPSTPQTGRRTGASVGYFWGSPGGWEGTVHVTQRAAIIPPRLSNLRDSVLIPCIGCARSFLHSLVWRDLSPDLSLSSFLTTGAVRPSSRGPPDLGEWTRPWDNPSAFPQVNFLRGNFMHHFLLESGVTETEMLIPINKGLTKKN